MIIVIHIAKFIRIITKSVKNLSFFIKLEVALFKINIQNLFSLIYFLKLFIKSN